MKRILSLMLSIAVILSVSPLTLAEEENYGENIALGKSVYSDTPFGQGYDVKNITDGDLTTEGAVADGASSDMRNGWRNYMIVDLGDAYELSRVIVRTRREVDAAWARMGIMAVAANNANFSDAVKLGSKDSAGEFKSDLNAKVNNVKARYVMVVNTSGSGHFAISDLEVYGEAYTGEGNGDFDDVTTQTQINATKLLFNLGIMKGVDKTTFGGPMLMTRAEAAELICKFADIAAVAPQDTMFSDVKADNSYSGYIQAGLEYNFISKDEFFRPDDFVLDCEFLKMVLCINGYLMKSVTGDEYPHLIYSLASETDLLKGTTNCGNGSYLNRADAAVILYNALIGKKFVFTGEEYIESDNTLLERFYDCRLMHGTVTGNGATMLDEKRGSVYINTIEIDNIMYSDDSGLSLGYLGEAVYFIVNEDNAVTGIWEDTKRTSKVTVYSSDIDKDNTDFNTITTDINNQTKRYNLASHPYKIFNDVANASVTIDDLTSENGHLVLVDNDNDGEYEIVKIYKPQILIVDSINSDDVSKELRISGIDGEKIDVEYGSISVKQEDGKVVTTDKIKSGRLIYVYASADDELITVQLQPTARSGIVTATGRVVAINQTKYETTDYFKRKFNNIETGKEVKFYLDTNNELVYIIDDEVMKKSEFMAVIQRFAVDEISEEVVVKVYDSNKTFRELTVADKAVIDGHKRDISDLIALGRSYFEGKLAIIRVSNGNQIKSMITENDTNGDLAATNKTLAGTQRGNAGFYSGTSLVLPITDNVPVFTVPVDEGGRPHTSSDFTNIYNVTELESTYGIRTKLGSAAGGEINIYGSNEFGEPTALVRKKVYSDSSSEFSAVSSYLAEGCMVFDEAMETVNDDGEIYYEITGYDIKTGAKKIIQLKSGLSKVVNTFKIRNSSWFANEIPEAYMPTDTWMTDVKEIQTNMINDYFVMSIDELERGDIIRYANGSYTSVSELELVVENRKFTSSECKVVYAAGDSPDTILATFRMQYAKARNIKDGHITFETTEGTYETLDLSFFEGNVIVLNGKNFEIYPISSAGVCISGGDRLVIYSNAGYHQSIVVYK